MRLLHIIIFVQLYIQPICHSKKYTASNRKEKLAKHSHNSHKPGKSQNVQTYKDDLPLLIWWTSDIFPHEHKQSMSKIKCNHGHCLTSGNRKYVNDNRTQAFLFYGTDLTPADLPLPRQPWHIWALFHEESPLNNYILCHQKFLRLFNFTATSRRESDFPLTMQWIPDYDYLTSRPPVPLPLKNKLKKEQGNAPILYIQSHCSVPSDRDRYVKELMKFIRVDSYGKCLNNKEIPSRFEDPSKNLNNPEFFNFIAPYKFHLAFENAYLEDYMTEKLIRTFHVGSIPIYKGAPNAKDWMPNNKSVIFVDDFETPRDLAEFIMRLDEDDQEYESYLKYKTEKISNYLLQQALDNREWRVNTAGYPDMIQSYECYVCDQVAKQLDLKRTQSSEVEEKTANKSHYGCSQPYTLMVEPYDVPAGDTWREVDWIALYWMAFDHALVVNEMMTAKESDSSKFHKYLQKLFKSRMKP